MIKEEIEKEYLEAYKAKDEFRISVLRMLRTVIKNNEIAERRELDDSDIISLVKKEIKQRKDTEETYQNAGRSDAAEKEKKEIEFLTNYLPEQLSEDEVRKIIQGEISSTGASDLSDTGRIIGAIMKKHGSQIDGSVVSKIVREELN